MTQHTTTPFTAKDFLDDLLPAHLTATLHTLIDDDEQATSACDRDRHGQVMTAVVATRRCLVTVHNPHEQGEIDFIPWASVEAIRIIGRTVVIHTAGGLHGTTTIEANTAAEAVGFAGLLAAYLPAPAPR